MSLPKHFEFQDEEEIKGDGVGGSSKTSLEDGFEESFSLDDDDSDDYDGTGAKTIPMLVILTAAMWTMIFAVFSFGFDTDPSNCIVSNKNDLIAVQIPYVDADMTNSEYENPEDKIDVAIRFKFFFDVCFNLSCIQCVVGILHMLLSKEIGSRCAKLLKFLFWLANLLIVLLWFFVFTVRYMQSG